MVIELTNKIQIEATLIPNEFIDKYMASASGEYVKVYLYILRHAGEKIEIGMIADALNHTEADIIRACQFWEKAGVLSNSMQEEKQRSEVEQPKKQMYSKYQIDEIARDEEFRQLIYVAQKYTGKMFNHRDYEIFAYLYNDLNMPAELLEYLVETCVESKHNDTRYFEKVAINWHKAGIKNINEAKERTSMFVKGYSGVMKAFGLAGRNPGAEENEHIRKWFYTYLFSPAIVVEACNRTMRAIHQPSFEYADRILNSWYQAGVKSMEDIEKIDRQRTEKRDTKDKKNSGNSTEIRRTSGNSKNQFHNFEQRNTDYNAIVMERLKERLKDTPHD